LVLALVSELESASALEPELEPELESELALGLESASALELASVLVSGWELALERA
jgi:hypothetical protein